MAPPSGKRSSLRATLGGVSYVPWTSISESRSVSQNRKNNFPVKVNVAIRTLNSEFKGEGKKKRSRP